jgi:hypothetical protein
VPEPGPSAPRCRAHPPFVVTGSLFTRWPLQFRHALHTHSSPYHRRVIISTLTESLNNKREGKKKHTQELVTFSRPLVRNPTANKNILYWKNLCVLNPAFRKWICTFKSICELIFLDHRSLTEWIFFWQNIWILNEIF